LVGTVVGVLPKITVEDGTVTVGIDVPVGTYVAHVAPLTCVWKILSGDRGMVVAASTLLGGTATVHLKDGQTFTSRGCTGFVNRKCLTALHLRCLAAKLHTVKAAQVIKRITELGGEELRQRGSHRIFRMTKCGVTAQTSVPDHGARDLGPGLVRAIERQMEPVFGEGWLR
jgi:predicted RNA binding protein YcfA (HicA-like mRNA interferase family)